MVHRGRRSGREYRTPVNVFATADGFVIALTYGAEHTDWVRNVLAAGGCELRVRGRVLRADSPRIFHDETRQAIRLPERQVLRLLGVADFMSLRTAAGPGEVVAYDSQAWRRSLDPCRAGGTDAGGCLG